MRPSRQQMYADDPTFLWKYILRSLGIVLAITSIALIGWSLAHQSPLTNTAYDAFDYAYYDAWPYSEDVSFLPWEFITLGLSALWNAANILVLLRRNGPINPAVNVTCDLLLWLGLGVTGAFAAVRADTYLEWYPGDDGDGGRKGTVIAVGAALGFLVLLAHFALFVSACRYTNARRVDAVAAVVAERMRGEMLGGDGVMRERRDVEAYPNSGLVPIGGPMER